MATACAASPGTVPLTDGGSLKEPFYDADEMYRKGAISISRMKPDQLHVYISPEFRLSARAMTEGQVAEMACNLANCTSDDLWVITELSRRTGGAYLITLEVL